MIAIILAGGKGTRLRSEVPNLPKPMANINGELFLHYLLNYLSEKGFKKVILSIGYLGQKIIDHFGYRYKNIEIFYELEKKPMGTGGAIKFCLKNVKEEYVFVLNGDSFSRFNPEKLIELAESNHCKAVLACCNISNTFRYGRVIVEDNIITSFEEKGHNKPGLISAGVYVLKKTALNDYKKTTFSIEEDFFFKEAEKRTLLAHIFDSYFIDIGTPEDYRKIEKEIKLIT